MSSWEDDRPENQEDFQESQNPLNLSRLAICNSYSTFGYDSFDNYDDDHALLKPMFSRLTIESFDADAEYSGDGKEEEENSNNVNSNNSIRGCLFSDSDDEKHQMGSCYSLPTTPLKQKQGNALYMGEAKQYLSDSGARKTWRRKRVLRRTKWEDVELVKDLNFGGDDDDEEEEDLNEMKNVERGYNYNFSNSFSGDSENGGVGLRVITRPKGGRRSLCMDMEEVKACRDLGFELEHERMFDLSNMSSGLTLSASTLDTATISSGGSSPIPNWRISSPGDDPRDVKARLKVWAQAVAIASTSRPGFS